MDFQTRIRELIKTLIENIHEQRKLILALSCVVVFITTYVLILPAFTLDKEEAAEQGGIDVPAVEQSVDADTATQEAVAEEPRSKESEESKTAEQNKAASEITLQNDESDNYNIAVAGKDAGLSEDMSINVREIDQSSKALKKEYDSLYSDALDAVHKEEGSDKPSEFAFAKFYDISLTDGKNEVEPDSAVDVKISFGKDIQKELKVADADRVYIVHFAVDKDTGEVTPEVLDTESTDITVKNNKVTEAAFTTDSFSVFAVVYTVDFHYSVDGKEYDFSLDGGGYASLSDIIKALKIDDKDAQGLLSDVESVTFSDPDLVWIGKADNDTTIGELKKANGLKPVYSADLSKEQIAKIDGQTVNAGDWALISLKPFETEESLTVTLKSGEKFVVNVTDAQISTNVLTADGKTYKITVTFGDDAEIPVGTRLVVKEIKPDSDEYLQHLGAAWAEVNSKYLEQEDEKLHNHSGLDEYEDIRPVNLDDARFFNVHLVCNGDEIEPKAPVQVDIQYVDGLETNVAAEEAVLGAVHFIDDTVNDDIDNKDAADGKVELIQAVDTVCDEDGKYIEFTYEQDSFSDIGTYVGQKTYDNMPFAMNAKLAMPLLNTLSNTREIPQLADIEAHKSLSDNHDGTYTMSLTVKGDSKAYEEYTKANILFVMDRSSSMTSNCVEYNPYNGPYDRNTTYYGTNDGINYFALNHIVWNGIHLGFSYSVGYSTYPYNGTVYTGVTRLQAEQAAMDVLIQNLLEKNDPDTPGKENLVEISVISFADQRCSGNTEYTGWTSSDYDELMEAVNQTNTPSGTNWEDALIYAREQASNKKQLEPDEDVYVIFLTDGEPTAVYGEKRSGTNGAFHYNNNEGGFEYALTEVGGPYDSHGRINDGKNALDRAKEIVDDGNKFYGIFTFNPGEAQTRYLRRLMNFAYTGVDKAYENDATKEDTDIVKKYFTNADTPEALTAAFEKIFADVSNTLGHGDVVITDGLQSADAMTTTIQANKADGFRYSVTDDSTGEELYYVTATGNDSNPTVTFHIDEQQYPAGASKEGVDGKPYYSVTVNGTEYRMALADLSGRELTWDLSAIGTLLPGCTYKVDIIVWPNQAAYDYVAGLNNNLPGYTWDSSVESNPDNYHEVIVDGVTYGYYTGGVEGHSSIVKYKDSGVYSVLTNTHQELNYSIVDTKTNEVTGETTTERDPQEPIPLEPQKPMDLVDTNSKIEKQWNVELDPSILEQLLYPADGSHYTLDFDIYQDTETNLYKTVTLGWDSTDNDYVWEKEFAIPTGLMLSEARMDALGMNKSAYPHGTYPADPDDPNSELITYYILENGHDYIIKERDLSFEFDFNADVFHPMLVDGKMQNVNFTRDDMSIDISNMTSTVGGLSSLKVENTLRGYIHLEKHVVDQNGVAIDDDKTKFEYTIVLTNEDEVFEGTHIPWYGINGLYRHDKDYNYYEVYYDNNVLKLKDESGAIYPVVGTYDLSYTDEQSLTYIDGGEEKELKLWGNLTTPSDGNKVATATLQMSQGEILSIANVPAGTQYSVVESDEPGYELVSIDKRIDPADVQEDPDATTIDMEEYSIEGEIVPNHHNYISYINMCMVTDIDIQKLDETGAGLPGAVFELKKLTDDEGHGEMDASDLESVRGLGDVTKKTESGNTTYHSAFETTEETHRVSGLPDGTYRLREVYIPAGYVCEYDYIEFTIKDRVVKDVKTDSTDSIDDIDYLEFTAATGNSIALLAITNTPGPELPHTGGIGTTIFYILGSILVIGGAIYFVSRRRMK